MPEWLCKHGDTDVALSNQVFRVLVGSTTHGLAVGSDDIDYISVCIEPPEFVTGLKHFDTAVLRTQPEGARSGPGDIDLTIYSLRHYMRLLLAGNPTILITLFVPMEAVDLYPVAISDASRLYQELRDHIPHIVSRLALQRFLGYLDKQLERLQGGGKRNRVPNRPELIEKYGYDTKYAMHALRLGLQGIELCDTGRLTLPMTEFNRTACLEVRNGEVPFEEALQRVQHCREQLRLRIDTNYSSILLPPHPNRDVMNRWLHRAHQMWWRTTN
jgi:predicted nucleotidyltransferase